MGDFYERTGTKLCANIFNIRRGGGAETFATNNDRTRSGTRCHRRTIARTGSPTRPGSPD